MSDKMVELTLTMEELKELIAKVGLSSVKVANYDKESDTCRVLVASSVLGISEPSLTPEPEKETKKKTNIFLKLIYIIKSIYYLTFTPIFFGLGREFFEKYLVISLIFWTLALLPIIWAIQSSLSDKYNKANKASRHDMSSTAQTLAIIFGVSGVALLILLLVMHIRWEYSLIAFAISAECFLKSMAWSGVLEYGSCENCGGSVEILEQHTSEAHESYADKIMSRQTVRYAKCTSCGHIQRPPY